MYGTLLNSTAAFLWLAFFIVGGVTIAPRLTKTRDLPTRLWIGSSLGLVAAMWFPALIACLLSFGLASQLLALVAWILMASAIVKFVPFNGGEAPHAVHSLDGPSLLLVPGATWRRWWTAFRSDSVFWLMVIIPFAVCLGLFWGHVLVEMPDGNFYGGQSTFGDLSLHLGIATSLAEQAKFPPEYSIFPGSLLSYPFLVDSLSSSLILFGMGLRDAFVFPSLIFAFTLAAGVYILARLLTKNRFAAVFVTLFFFFNGGFGFAYFLDLVVKDPTHFTRFFTEWYQTPTNLNDQGLRWSNTIADMIIPQRTSMAGWTIVLPAFWFVRRAIEDRSVRFFAVGAVLGGSLPMIHTHSFLAFGIIVFVWALVDFFGRRNQLKRTFLEWAGFAFLALALAFPQLFVWTFTQASGHGFLHPQTGWSAIEHDNFFWFWLKNLGVVFVLLIPVLFSMGKEQWKIYSGPIVLFVLSNLVQFQPNSYDNNKLLYIWYYFSLTAIAVWLVRLYPQIPGRGARAVLAFFVFFFGTLSGSMTLVREYRTNGFYEQYSQDAVITAEFIKKATPRDSLFLTSNQHLNPVAALAGRSLYVGTPYYLYFHGLQYQDRENEVTAMFEQPWIFPGLALKHKIDYLFVSNDERSRKVDEGFVRSRYPLIYQRGEFAIYAISERAQKALFLSRNGLSR